MAKIDPATKRALDLQSQSLDLQKLDTERKDRELAAQIAIANAQQSLNEWIAREVQLGTLNEQKRANLVAEAQKQAEQEFSQMMAMRNYGLDVGKLTGNYQGMPTLERQQMEINTIMNAPRGPADYAAYVNRLRGLNATGNLPGVLQNFVNGEQVAAYSNGGQQTGPVLSNTDLAKAMVQSSRTNAGLPGGLPVGPGGTPAGTPSQMQQLSNWWGGGANPSNVPTTNFLLPLGPAKKDPNDPTGQRYLYQEFMLDPAHPELGYRQPNWAGPQPAYAPAPTPPPTHENPPPTPPPPALAYEPNPNHPQTYHSTVPGWELADPTNPQAGWKMAGHDGTTGQPGQPVDPLTLLPQHEGGSWRPSGYTGKGEWSPYLWANEGYSGYFEPRQQDDEHSWGPWWEQVGKAGPEPTWAPPTWDELNAIRQGNAAPAAPQAVTPPTLAYEADPGYRQIYRSTVPGWELADPYNPQAGWKTPTSTPTGGTTTPPTQQQAPMGNSLQWYNGQWYNPVFSPPTGQRTSTSQNGYQDPSRTLASPATQQGQTTPQQAQSQGLWSGDLARYEGHVNQTPEMLASQQRLGGDRTDLQAVKNMFSGVFSPNGMPQVPEGYKLSYASFRNLSPTEQALLTGYAGESGQPESDFLEGMRRAAPNFSASPTARWYGLQ